MPDHGIELLDFYQDDWDLAVFNGYPRGYVLGRRRDIERRPDVVYHTMWESSMLPPEWVPLLNRAGAVVTPSHFCKQVIQQSGVTTAVFVCPYGVDAGKFARVDRRDRKDFVFLAIDRTIFGRKGALDVLKAFIELKKERRLGKDAKLVVRLMDDTFRECRVGGRKCGDVEFVVGSLDDRDIVLLYQNADVLVYPTRGEGFGLEPLEAMATGCYAVLPAWGGVMEYATTVSCFLLRAEERVFDREPFVHYGKMAFVSLEQIKDAMEWCYANRAVVRAMGAEASAIVERAWTWDRAAEKFAHILYRVRDLQ